MSAQVVIAEGTLSAEGVPLPQRNVDSVELAGVPGAQVQHQLLLAWQSLYIYFLHALQCFLTVGIHVYFSQFLRYPEVALSLPLVKTRDTSANRDNSSAHASAWKTQVGHLLLLWKITRIASGIFLPVGTLAALQIDRVLNNLILRTVVISAVIFALGSFISSCVCLGLKDRMSSPEMATRWVEASSRPIVSSPRVTEFWAAITLPLSSMAWCLLWFMTATFALACDHGDQNGSYYSTTTLALCGLWISFLAIVLIIQLWRALKTLIPSKAA